MRRRGRSNAHPRGKSGFLLCCRHMHQTSFARRLLAALTALGMLLPTLPLHAATLGSLIKGPGEAVYYLGLDGRRYVFPNANAYKTWYEDFSQVKTVSTSELAGYPIGGNVTYKPGTRLVKITTDPRVYAVAAGGVLRWVQTEAVATSLYGADWSKKVDDIPDAFFVNYTMGSYVVNTSDFLPASVTMAATSIDADLTVRRQVSPQPLPPVNNPPAATSTTPTTTTTQQEFTFSVSKQHVQGGDTVLLTGVSNIAAGISKIELFGDGQLVKLCTFQSCTGEFTIPVSGPKDQYVFEGRLTRQDATVVSRLITLPLQTNGSDKVMVTVGQANILPSQLGSVVVDISPDIAINRVDISVGGTIVKGCADGARQCRWADYIANAQVGTTYPVFAKVTDTLGRIYQSKTTSITVSTNDSPSVTVSAAKTSAYVGEKLDATATAGDNDGIAAIEVLLDGAVMKHCDSPAPCTVSVGPFDGPGMHQLTARASDTKGMWGTAPNPANFDVVAKP